MAELTFAEISKLLKYDHESGKLFWLPRPVEMFSSETDNIGAEARARIWNERYAGKEALTAISNGYRIGRIGGRTLKSHRVAWLLHFGSWPSEFIDHINGIRDDNRIANLRHVSPAENTKNSKRNVRNRSGVCGVSWEARTGKWAVHLSVQGRGIFVGRFDSIDLAAKAREEASAKYGFSARHGLS